MIALNEHEKQEFATTIDASYRKFIVCDLLEIEIVPGYAPGSREPITLKVVISLTDEALDRETFGKIKYDQFVDHTILRNITPTREALMRTTLAGIDILLNLRYSGDNHYGLSIRMKNKETRNKAHKVIK